MRTALLALLLLALAAQPAAAAKPRFLGSGGDPGVAVDAAGTAHVAWWTQDLSGADVVHYCQVPRGAKACAVARVLAVPASSGLHGMQVQVLLPAPATIQIVAPWVNDPGLLYTSIDGGASFGLALLGELQNVETALLGPGASISLSNDGPAGYARYGFDGAGPAEWPVGFSDRTEALDTELGLLGGRPMVFFSGDAGLKSYLWNGAGDPNDQATWVPGPAMAYGRWYPSAASGPSGTFLAYTDRARKRVGVFVRRVRAGRFGKPRRIATSDSLDPQLVQWPDGALTVVYSTGSRTLRRDSRNGRRWSRPRRLFSGNEPSSLQLAAGPRGGWIVWDGAPGLSDDEPIRIVRLRRPR